MTDNIEKFLNKDDMALLKDLENRYKAPGLAQHIFDQIKKAESRSPSDPGKIDYMGAKALSEVSELYRREAQGILKRLKILKRSRQKAANDCVNREDISLEKDLQKYFRFFLRCNKAYFTVYRQAMQTYKTGTYIPGGKIGLLDQAWQKTMMAVAA